MMYRSRDDKDGTIVYVGGLLAEVKKEEIESEFEKFGKLLRVWVAFNPPGFAFVEFFKKEDAESAVSALHNETVLGSKLRVEISRSRGKVGSGGDRRGRGGFRGGRNPDFHGGGFGRGGFGNGRPTPYDRNGDMRGRGGMAGRIDDFDDRRRSAFDERDLDTRSGFNRGRDFGDDLPRFGANRDLWDIDGIRRGYGDRDIGGRDFPTTDIGGRDFPARNVGGREFSTRDVGGRDFPTRDVGGRDFATRDVGGRDFSTRDVGGRDFSTRDVGSRDFPTRDVGSRDFPSRDIGDRDFPTRDIGGIPPRVIEDRDFLPRNFSRDFGESRESRTAREFGMEDLNGMRGLGGNTRDTSYSSTRDVDGGRNFGIGQASIPNNNAFGVQARDIGGRNFGSRDVDNLRDYGVARDTGIRRENVRDFNTPRDIDNPREFIGGRSTRVDFPEKDRFGAGGGRGQKPGGFDSARFSGGDFGGSGNYGGYNARDRFRSRSPIGRGRPHY